MDAAACEDIKSASDSSFSEKETPSCLPNAMMVPILSRCNRMGMASALLKPVVSTSIFPGCAYLRMSRMRKGLVEFNAAWMIGSFVEFWLNAANKRGALPAAAIREKFPCWSSKVTNTKRASSVFWAINATSCTAACGSSKVVSEVPA